MADILEIDTPAILNLPEKLLPLLTRFNDYDYFLIEGGRGSAKTQSVGRIILYIGETNEVRVVCGREIQSSIEESVHAVLSDLIENETLYYDITKSHIRYKGGGTEIRFKGFREQGRVKIKGLEGVDILWIDEAESITAETLKIIIPTIRKQNAKVIFTMNRHLRSDAVPNFLAGRKDCLHIRINYYDNPHCPLKIKVEAETLKNKNPVEYRHIYEGEPLEKADGFLFNHGKLWEALGKVPWGERFPKRQRVLGIDWAAQGTDMCVATFLDRETNLHWKLTERIAWNDADPMFSIGKIVDLIGQFKPDVTALDIGGGGFIVAKRLEELGLDIIWYDGGTTVNVDTTLFANLRAQEYYNTKEWFDEGRLIIQPKDQEVIEEAEKIKMTYRSSGVRLIQSKKDMKADPEANNTSPDNIDSLKIAIYATKFIGQSAKSHNNQAAHVVRRVSNSTRARTARVSKRRR